MVRPASRTSVFSPFSVSSFAAQPPVMPEPTIIASYVLVAMQIPLCLLLRGQRHTAMMGARNDLQVQFLREGNFRSVVAVNSDAFKDVEKLASQLFIALLRNGVAVTHPANALCGNGFVHGTEQSYLLRGRSVHEILSEEFVALFVHSGETIEKILARFVVGPVGKNDVDEFINSCTLGAGRVGRGNDLIDHGNDGVILMRVESAQGVSGRRVRSLEKSKEIRGQGGQNAASHQQFQRFTPLHRSSSDWLRTQIIFVLGRRTWGRQSMLFTQKLFAHIFQNISGALDSDFSRENGIFIFNTENAFETDVHVGLDDRLPETGTVAIANSAESLRGQVKFVGFKSKVQHAILIDVPGKENGVLHVRVEKGALFPQKVDDFDRIAALPEEMAQIAICTDLLADGFAKFH